MNNSRKEIYRKQVVLLLRVLPDIARHQEFALKGGTAINLFLQPLPRLSVDIDLVYLPITDRKKALEHMNEILRQVGTRLARGGLVSQIKLTAGIPKLFVETKEATIKVEPNGLLRGSVFPVTQMSTQDIVKSSFGFGANMPLLDPLEIYAGKICAALDRQHPRDIFDIMKLFEILDPKEIPSLRSLFCVYMAMHDRPMDELLAPKLQSSFDATFEEHFSGMTDDSDLKAKDLREVFAKLLKSQILKLTEGEKKFIKDIQSGIVDPAGLQLAESEKAVIPNLPGIKWRIMNVKKLEKDNPRKFKAEVKRLSEFLEI